MDVADQIVASRFSSIDLSNKAVPMRRTPDINFGQLPQGVTTEITDTSKFGFTVEFKGATGTLDPFGFSASAEL